MLLTPFDQGKAIAQETTKVTIEVLSREDCSHCQDEEAYLNNLLELRNDIQVNILDLSVPENQKLWEQITELEKLPKVTPITIIGDSIIQGFDTAETSGKQFEKLIDYYQSYPSQINGFQAYLDNGGNNQEALIVDGTCTEECVLPDSPNLMKQITLPFIGSLDLTGYSLPALAAILGFIDGFNPCAMWVLVTFLLILAQLKSRKKMLFYAGLFIIAEAIMYTLILTVWYTTWDFVGLDRIVTPIVGLVAIGGGMFFLYEWKTSKPGECKVTNLQQRQKIRSKIQAVINKPLGLGTAVGIIVLAFSVNIIEFACSIGIPQTFTKIIELNDLSLMASAGMIAIYILMYMVDDFIVFGLALYSFDKIGLSSKYSKLSNLIGGVILILLGMALIINPNFLQIM